MKTIIITGCSTGIGLYCAQTFHLSGQYRVITTCRRLEDCYKLHKQGIESIPLDLDDPTSVAQAGEQLLNMTQHSIDALFNNAGFGLYGQLMDISRDELMQQFSTNFFGMHQLTLHLLPGLIAAGDARIIQMSSILGLIATPRRGAYAASKYALEAWSDALRMELRQYTNVKVSLIEPGPIMTAFSQNVRQRETAPKVQNSRLVQKFALGPDAVFKKVHHALTHPRPKIRYRVTLLAQLVARLKRILPDNWMEKLLLH